MAQVVCNYKERRLCDIEYSCLASRAICAKKSEPEPILYGAKHTGEESGSDFPFWTGHRETVQLLRNILEGDYASRSMPLGEQSRKERQMANWICLLAAADAQNWSQAEVMASSQLMSTSV